MPQEKYRMRNWKKYNTALVQRGSITIWFSEDSIGKWLANERTFRRGRPNVYSNDTILCALIIRSVYHLPLRALQGFIASLIALMYLSLPVPCYTQICRRAMSLGQEIKKLSNKRPTDIIFDSTGMKIYGEGEWKVKIHGKSKRRTWRKIHLAVCPDSHDIILECLTENNVSDSEVVPSMQKKLPKTVKRSYGDGAYDKEGCYQAFFKGLIDPIVPPQRNAVLQDEESKPWQKSRNNAVREIAGLGGDDDARKLWKILKGYHRRSLGETAMYRLKTLFGGSLRSRKMSNQKAEVYSKCLAINKMNGLGMPKGRWVIA